MKKFRNNGAIGALLDEYEKVIEELQQLINDVSDEELSKVVSSDESDPFCKSIQTILSHVIRSGYWFAVEAQKFLNEDVEFPKEVILPSVSAYQNELTVMFKYNEQFLLEYPNLEIDEIKNQRKVTVAWGQIYSIEQLFEHAIVHVSRHRRQIEKYLQKMRYILKK